MGTAGVEVPTGESVVADSADEVALDAAESVLEVEGVISPVGESGAPAEAANNTAGSAVFKAVPVYGGWRGYRSSSPGRLGRNVFRQQKWCARGRR